MKQHLSRAIGGLGIAIVLCLATALTASAGTIFGISWAVSNPHPGATGVRYTWSFPTASDSDVDHITFSVPDGTTAPGGLGVAGSWQLPAGSATLDTATDLVTYTFFGGPVHFQGGHLMQLEIDGFTNTSTPGQYQSQLTTYLDTTLVDQGTSAEVLIDINQTEVTVQVARTTSMTNSADQVVFLMDPSAPWLTDMSKPVNIEVSTNAGNGYTVSARIDHQLQNSAGTRSIGAASGGVDSGNNPPPVNTFGYGAHVNGDGTSNPTLAGILPLNNTVGFTTAGEVFGSSNGPTNFDNYQLSLRTRIDYHTPADTYTATITFTVAPSY